MITSFLVIIFFSWLIIFFFAEGDKKNYSAKKKKLLTNKRSYSSNGNTIIPMIWRFYATPTSYFWQKSEKNITTILQMGGNFRQPNLCCTSKHLLFNFNFFRAISLLLKISFTDCYQSDNFLFAKSKLSTKNIFVNIAAKLCPGVRLFAFFHFLKIWNDNFFFKIIEKW